MTNPELILFKCVHLQLSQLACDTNINENKYIDDHSYRRKFDESSQYLKTIIKIKFAMLSEITDSPYNTIQYKFIV